MSVRRAVASALLAVSLGALAGCGYHDDNPAAVHVVVQSYLDAIAAKDATIACRLTAADQRSLLAARAGGDCAAGAATTFAAREPPRRAGAETLDTLTAPATAAVDVPGYGTVSLLRVGSLWRIVAGPHIHP
ncbi:MAG: hypothetical protein ACR2LK_04080 [Solirubrobacteraceae bacterium]